MLYANILCSIPYEKKMPSSWLGSVDRHFHVNSDALVFIVLYLILKIFLSC